MSISPAPVFWLLAEDPCAGHYLLLSRFFPRKTPFTFAEPSGVARGFIRARPRDPSHATRAFSTFTTRASAPPQRTPLVTLHTASEAARACAHRADLHKKEGAATFRALVWDGDAPTSQPGRPRLDSLRAGYGAAGTRRPGPARPAGVARVGAR